MPANEALLPTPAFFRSFFYKSNAIIAAGSVVLENTVVESGCIYAGVPAKKVKEVSPEHFKDLNERIANNYVMYSGWFNNDGDEK